ncbi:MAG: nickel pincer cofactor biosynthesis protein LarC [Phycisphaerales bacterium]|nr:nickel pincer cofactor biosynthesis protein LarC [Phycisphaerales bacterium]
MFLWLSVRAIADYALIYRTVLNKGMIEGRVRPMRIGYFDCFSGAAGDMILGALLAAGLESDQLRSDLSQLNLDDYQLDIRQIQKQGFAAVKVDVNVNRDQGHRHLHHITDIINAADLSETVKQRAKRIFTRLAEAEAKVHGTTVEKIHFHEVGGVDAIVDIVGAAIGIEHLGLDRIICSPIPTGSGTVTCEHGIMPVPAPATTELLVGVPLADCDEVGELTTPTGAAILTTLASGYGSLPSFRIERTGYGAGNRDNRKRPNVLRLIIGQASDDTDLHDEVILLEANLDDATGEQIGYTCDRLFEAGALDVFTTPILMKKNRPGTLLSVLAPVEKEAECERVIFAETTTFGLRRDVRTRRKLERRSEAVSTPYGTIRVKMGLQNGDVMKTAPEYDDCAAAARAHGVSLREVMDATLRAWTAQQKA